MTHLTRKNFDFCLTNNSWQGIRMIFTLPWRGICAFWQQLVRWDRALRLLYCHQFLANKKYDSCVANDSLARTYSHFFDRRGLAKTKTSPQHLPPCWHKDLNSRPPDSCHLAPASFKQKNLSLTEPLCCTHILPLLPLTEWLRPYIRAQSL